MAETLKIQILSDLHLEVERGEELGYGSFEIDPASPILALLGDIGLVAHPPLFAFLRKLLAKFETVLYVAGNHESYRGTYEDMVQKLEQFEKEIRQEREGLPDLGEFVFLNRRMWSPQSSPNIVSLGCTLWTQLNADDLDILTIGMSDFKQIEGLNPQMYDSLHIEDCSWLEAQLDVLSSTHETTSTLKDSPDSRATVERKVVVFTHHPPTSKASDPKHIDPSYPNPISSGFVNDMGKAAEGLDLSGNPRKRGVLIRPPIRTWAFGHTHWCFDEMQNGVRLVSNQRGYRDGKENRDLHFRKDFVIVL